MTLHLYTVAEPTLMDPAEVATRLRCAAQQLAAKVDHEYAGLTVDQRFELRNLGIAMETMADHLAPIASIPEPDNEPIEIRFRGDQVLVDWS